MKELKQKEFIEFHPFSKEYFRVKSPLGYRLRTKNLLKPLKREKAFNILDDFLKRVQLANQNKEYLHHIVYVGLFGSLTKENIKYVNDIDIYINLHIKRPNDYFIYDFKHIFKMENKLCSFLKNKSRYIQLIDRDNLNSIINQGFKLENMQCLFGFYADIIKRT